MITLRRPLQLGIQVLFYFQAAFYRTKNHNFQAILRMKISQFLPEKIDCKVNKIFC